MSTDIDDFLCYVLFTTCTLHEIQYNVKICSIKKKERIDER